MAERQNTEWKAIWKDEYLAWICGFANTQGGKLYIGIDDNGNIIGIQNTHKLLEDLPNKIRDAMGIIVNINLLQRNLLLSERKHNSKTFRTGIRSFYIAPSRCNMG